MIAIRTEKLRFILEEMQITSYLTEHLTDPFVSRTLARHIFVRARSFIDIVRSLRKPLNVAGHVTHEFHKTKEAYADTFDEVFQKSRDRLGAHVQDLDFGERIELWNDIEIGKIGFFVDEARQLYDSLSAFNLHEYIQYVQPTEITDGSLLAQLQSYQRGLDRRTGIELGTDSLAVTRNNTSAALNLTPVHARAAQLALIRRWITLEQDLLQALDSHPRIARIVKARLVTDIASFCDCLVTRQLQSGAPQEMDGLDKLVEASGQSASPINDFVSASNFDNESQLTRDVRNYIGAHIEASDTSTITSLIADLDAYDLDRGLKFYERMLAAFLKTCHTVLFLRTYVADGVRIYGVAMAGAQAISYSGNAPASLVPVGHQLINDESAYYQNLLRWIAGNDSQKGDARQFFQAAFMASTGVETINESDHFSQGYSPSHHEFGQAHQFLLTTLTGGVSDPEFISILELILACAGLTPYQLVEALVRYARTNANISHLRISLICHVLGEIASAPHASARKFLEDQSRHNIWEIALGSTLARFKTYVRSEGIFRLNHKGAMRVDYDEFVGSLTSTMSETEKSIAFLAFASALCSQRIGSCLRPFTSNYARLQNEIEARLSSLLANDAEGLALLKALIAGHDYVGVCALISKALTTSDQPFLREALLDSCCNGTITPANYDQASRNLSCCFLMKNNYRRAFEIISNLASKNPEQVDLQIHAVEILTQIPGEETAVSQRITSIRQTYKLSSVEEKHLSDLEQVMATHTA